MSDPLVSFEVHSLKLSHPHTKQCTLSPFPCLLLLLPLWADLLWAHIFCSSSSLTQVLNLLNQAEDYGDAGMIGFNLKPENTYSVELNSIQAHGFSKFKIISLSSC